jgi:hypothetical protein
MKNLIIVFALLATSTAQAQKPADPSGHWKGTIEIPGNALDFEMDIARNFRGEWIGAVTSGTDHVTVPLQKVGLDGRQLTFWARTDQPFHGEFADSGDMVSGTATLSGYTLSFGMSRTGDARIEPRPTSLAVSKDLEGVWNGVLSAGGRELHFVLSIANQPDGTALAHQVNVDEGGLMLYLVVGQNGRHVTIEARGVAASFVGDLNAAGTEVSGTWTQGTTSLPLTLTRAKVEGQR